MYRTIDDFVNAYTHESQSTAKVLGALNDSALGQEKTAGDWTAGGTAWHIAECPCMITNQFGTDITPSVKPATLTTKAISDEYARNSSAVLEQVKGKFSDADLTKEVSAFNYPMPLGVWLNMLINHEVHHRAQLGILMRQAGLTVPGVYGPNKEETAAYLAQQGNAEAAS